ncbi:MAG: hypothetical protein A2Z97_07390 [Bdellovibrionales bacterium GWB1_52_6]|nr:MAG: hypothetical protein A2Z97_07390 [Bdellovibrionales bacterium GWB1_52_6]OFZ06513.1 MAG: hypothetical protein A2X97_16980 [Bdellovibrionales bacterium GWA1_52_35]
MFALSLILAVAGIGILGTYTYVSRLVEKKQGDAGQTVQLVKQFSELESEFKSIFLSVERYAVTGDTQYQEAATNAQGVLQKLLAELQGADIPPELKASADELISLEKDTLRPLFAKLLQTGNSSGTDQNLKESLAASAKVQTSIAQAVLSGDKILKDDFTQMARYLFWLKQGLFTLIIAFITIMPLLLIGLGRDISNAMTGTITVLKSEVREANETADSISAASESLAQATTEQAAALQETAASIEEISAMVGKNSENSKRAADLAGTSQKSTEQGALAVEEMVRSSAGISDANQKISDQINASNQQISEIVTLISEISQKTKVINDIVFQTKLLSFNASVEAARAGEHGKGFAVVAEEVGSLAAMSGKAAREIEEMLTSSTEKVTAIVNANKASLEQLMKEAGLRVDEGVQVALKCGEVFSEIVGHVTELAGAADEISTASQEQSHGIREIAKAMGEMDKVTHQNATISSQVSRTVEQLKEQALQLNQTITSIEDVIHGKNIPAPAEREQTEPVPTTV